MWKFKWGLVFFILFICTSCNQAESELKPPPPVTDEHSGISVDETPFPYKFFELSVNYDGIDDQTLVQYRYSGGKIFARYEDHGTDQEIEGERAVQQIQPKLKQLKLTQETEAKGLIERIKDVFPIREDYRFIEVKVRFNDGEEKVYKTS
ncbi:hypothetical protein GCM10008967_18400 [Bacillus carboniphilus]|uniref:YusW-like protein n=1 Tax=Bacillus carboniphilus TaxID=86663 RepID=A0ABP3FYW3_9BACI